MDGKDCADRHIDFYSEKHCDHSSVKWDSYLWPWKGGGKKENGIRFSIVDDLRQLMRSTICLWYLIHWDEGRTGIQYSWTCVTIFSILCNQNIKVHWRRLKLV